MVYGFCTAKDLKNSVMRQQFNVRLTEVDQIFGN